MFTFPKVPAGSTSGPGKHWKADRPCNVKSRLTLCRSTSVPALFSLGTAVQYSTEKKWDNLTIRIYPGANAEFTLYEDEFDNYNYEKGAYSTITLKWNDQDRTLTIDDRKGSYKGMLKSRKFNLIVVEPGKGCGDGDSTTFDKSISYRGKKVIAKL